MGVIQSAIKEFFDQVRSLLWPETYFTWRTLLMLSLFSWLVALALRAVQNDGPLTDAEGDTLAVNFLTTLSWIFLTSAIWWALAENKIKLWGFSISPWITGAVLCTFAFHPWEADRFRWALSSWPMISVAIAALPDFVSWELKFSPPKKDKQQQLVMVLLVNLLLNSWILFYFRVQDWLNNYPSLLASNLDRSAFVYDLAGDRQPKLQGTLMVDATANAITDQLDGLPWYQTERWLYNRQDRLEAIAQQVNNNLDAPDERAFWQMAVPNPRRLGEGYLLILKANWLGPVADNRSLEVEKTCKIMPTNQPRPAPKVPSIPPNAASPTPNTAPQVTKTTVVDCGEDPATFRWIDPP
ncbi:MAG: DUF5357 family protein [Phormidesmis sp.]